MSLKSTLRYFATIALAQIGLVGCADAPLAKDAGVNEVVVKFRSPQAAEKFVAAATTASPLHTKLSLRKMTNLGCGDAHLIRFSGGSIDDFVVAFKESTASNPLFEYIVPNRPFHVHMEPAAHHPLGDVQKGWNLTRVSAHRAWEKISDASSVIVAIVDSGTNYRHPDLSDNIWQNDIEITGKKDSDDDDSRVVDDFFGARFIEEEPAGDPLEMKASHGTYVAGVIGATGKHNPEVRGIAPKVRLLSVKILTDEYFRGEPANELRGIAYAVRMGAKIINLSWGVDGDTRPHLKACLEQVAKDHPEILFVVSAGNRGVNIQDEPHYPATYSTSNMLVVTSSTRQQPETLWTYSNWDPKLVHLAAPGTAIWSTAYDGGHGMDTGTTYATPHVSGAAALLKAQHPHWTYVQLKAHLMASVDKLGSLEKKVASGGRLNVRRAVYGPFEQLTISGGTNWKIGSAQKIRWQELYMTPVCDHIDILWSTDGGTNFGPLEIAVPYTLKHTINVPAGATTQGVVRVQCSKTQFKSDSFFRNADGSTYGTLITTHD